MASSRGYWLAGRREVRTDEPIEVVGDVEFFEEDVEEPTRPGEAVCAVRQFSKIVEAVAFVASAATWTRSGVQVRDL